jgi:hypothetical protein
MEAPPSYRRCGVKVRINFTVDIPRHRLATLRECAGVDTNADAAEFVRGEAREGLRVYLEDNVGNDIVITEPWERT